MSESRCSPFTWSDHPVVETDRLRLRRVERTDADAIERLAGDFDVARMTALIPHPYEPGMADEWMDRLEQDHDAGRCVVFAVTLRSGGEFVGVAGLTFAWEHERAEIGYWFGKPYWGRGYATEAARAVVALGFERTGIERVHAGAFGHNPASQRVLRKAGLREEGTRRRHLVRFGQPADVVDFGLLRSEWNVKSSPTEPPGG